MMHADHPVSKICLNRFGCSNKNLHILRDKIDQFLSPHRIQFTEHIIQQENRILAGFFLNDAAQRKLEGQQS